MGGSQAFILTQRRRRRGSEYISRRTDGALVALTLMVMSENVPGKREKTLLFPHDDKKSFPPVVS